MTATATRVGAPIDQLGVAAYTIPTDFPEADGTLAWDSTTIVVVHASAGFAALASVLYIGRRHVIDNKPHNVPLIALGTGLLWFG